MEIKRVNPDFQFSPLLDLIHLYSTQGEGGKPIFSEF